MELLNNLSDDQIALLGCGVALIISATLMWLSYAVRSRRRHAGSGSPGRQGQGLTAAQPAKAAKTTKRKAA